MQARESFRPVVTSPPYPSLPFILPGVTVAAEPSVSAVIARLDLLEQLARETHGTVELLRRESSEVLHILREPPPLPEPAAAPALRAPAAGETGRLCFYLFGTFEVRARGGAITRWASRKARQLLAYLAMEPKRLVPKDVLIDLFWPEFPPARGSNNLSIAIYQVRASIKELAPNENHGVCVQQGLYSLDPATPHWVDVEEFQRHLSLARAALPRRDRESALQHLEAAVELYRGDFLQSDLYEEWAVEPRRSYREAYSRALDWLAADAAGQEDWPRVFDLGKRMVDHDPCDEQGHRWLMTANWRLGNRGQALLQYRVCSERLQAELGVPPSEETQSLFLAIKGQG